MTENQNLPKRNHYAPKSYLRGFSLDGENVFRLDKKTDDIKELPIPVAGF